MTLKNMFSALFRAFGFTQAAASKERQSPPLAEHTGNYFSENFKVCPFQEGDILCAQRENGRFGISKIPKVDRVQFQQGDTINIQGTVYSVAEPDFLLIVGCAYGEDTFESLDAARHVATTGKWRVGIGHIPNRAPGAAEGQQLIGHAPVRDDELEGYRYWRAEFDAGRAGVF